LGDGAIIVVHMLLVYVREAFGNQGGPSLTTHSLDYLLDVAMNFFSTVQTGANVFDGIAAIM
jgi:hypothetical protein